VASVAAVFDLDGTLVTFEFDVKGTRKAIIEELSKRGFDTSALGMTTPTQTMVDTARMQVESGKVNADFDEVRAKLYAILDASEMESSKEANIFPGTRETLEYLKSKNVRLAVLTNSGKGPSAEILRRAGLRDCFEFVLCRDEVLMMKPRPDGLVRAISLLRMPRDHVFYVGDSKYDIIAAKEAGLRVIGVASGNYSAAMLKDEGADYVISSLSELPALLGVQTSAVGGILGPSSTMPEH
jgi:HAD superfamily hydrolase (TIGR01549 family)